MSHRLCLKSILLAFTLVSATRGFAANHVRVVLDTSGSMVHNDRPRLAVLSTLLLFDLAKPNLSLDDTFAVMPFDASMPEWKSGPPPAVHQPWIRAVRDKRSDFQNAVKALQYRVLHTYYFPHLAAAIADLRQNGTSSDRRVIVLVTDGLPEDPDDARLIGTELVPQLLHENIRLYILALGQEASREEDKIRRALGGLSVGELLTDPDGGSLLAKMIDIFSRSFGYTGNAGSVSSSSAEMDLEGSQNPDRVAVVVYWRRPDRPSLRVRTVPDGDVNNPDGLRTGEESGGSYAVSWILRPRPGSHKLLTSADGARFIVLRPASLILEIQPQSPNGQIYSAIARTPFPLRIVVRPGSGNRGDPGPMHLSFKVHGPRKSSGYVWDEEQSPPLGEGVGHEDGRYFDIAPKFPRDPVEPEPFYEGFVTVEVRRGEAVIGSLTGDRAHRMSVYPFMKLQPAPPEANTSIDGQQRLLGRHERGCASFRFALDGKLPHSGQPEYVLRTVIDPTLSSSPQLNGAEYTLDNESVSYGANPGPRPGSWFTGRRLTGAELLNQDHRICVLLGRPREVEAGQPLRVKVQFSMLETPYEINSTITPFTLDVLIGPPNWMERNAAWLALAMALTLLLLHLWYSRFRPTVPANLQVATGKPPSSPALLGEGSVLRRWLGLTVEKPIHVDNGSYTVGWIRPIDRELYHFRPASGARLVDPEYQDGNTVISVNRVYEIGTDRGSYQFRLQYT